MDTHVDFSAFLMNRLKVDTLTPELLAGPTYELMKGSCKSLVELKLFLEEVYKETTYQLDCRKYTTSVSKTKAADYRHIKWIEDLVPHTMWSQEPVSYDKHALWESPIGGANVNSSTDLLSTWSLLEMSTLNVESSLSLNLRLSRKLTNLMVEERFAFNVSLRMFTRSIVIQRCAEDLQLGVESYQKKLNLTKPDTYHFDLKRKEAYTAYSNLRGFIYQNKDKQNRLMQINELHKFSDGTLNDVRTALDDRLKGIRMKYLPQTIWRKSDKERAATMI
nr:hypothetical protein [Tanacetum cinerariifolium]